jgi:hypothetical protein
MDLKVPFSLDVNGKNPLNYAIESKMFDARDFLFKNLELSSNSLSSATFKSFNLQVLISTESHTLTTFLEEISLTKPERSSTKVPTRLPFEVEEDSYHLSDEPVWTEKIAEALYGEELEEVKENKKGYELEDGFPVQIK